MNIGKSKPTLSLLQLLHLGAWLAIFLLSWGAFIRMMSLGDSLRRASLNTLLFAVLFYGVGWLYKQYYETRRFANFGIGLISLMILISVLRFLINREFDYIPGVTTYYQPGEVSFAFGAVITNLLTLLNSLLYHTVRSRMVLRNKNMSCAKHNKLLSYSF